MNYRNKSEYKLLNITTWTEYFKDIDTSDMTLHVAVWDKIGDQPHPEHGNWSKYQVIEAVRDAFSEDEVKIHYIEFSGDIIKDIKRMLELKIKVCTLSLVGFNLLSYVNEDPCVQQFLDEVFIINSAGNDKDEPIQHPALHPPELLVEAAGYRGQLNPPIGWLAYSNHEEGFTPDCACLTDIWVEKCQEEYGGTSSSAQTMGIEVIFVHKYFAYHHKRWPKTKEVNALTYENFYIPFESFYEGVKRQHRLAILPPDPSVVYRVDEEGKVHIMEQHKVVLTLGEAQYTVDGQPRMNYGVQFDKDGKPYKVPVPFMAVNGRTQISLDIMEKLFEDFGTIKDFVADWDSSKPEEVIVTFMA